VRSDWIGLIVSPSDTPLFYIDTFRENSTTLIDRIVAPLNEAKIPFSSTYGVGLFLYESFLEMDITKIMFFRIMTTSRTSHILKKYDGSSSTVIWATLAPYHLALEEREGRARIGFQYVTKGDFSIRIIDCTHDCSSVGLRKSDRCLSKDRDVRRYLPAYSVSRSYACFDPVVFRFSRYTSTFCQGVFSWIIDVLRLPGGWSPGPTSAPLPDWVDPL